MLLNSLEEIVARLRRGKNARKQFVESHINKTLAHQIRATRDHLGWSQERLAREVGMNQNAISRLESPDYGKPTITTLKRLAAALDVALVVRLVPFSELAHWVSGTFYLNQGLSTESLTVADFSEEYGEERNVEPPAISPKKDTDPLAAAAPVNGDATRNADPFTEPHEPRGIDSEQAKRKPERRQPGQATGIAA